MRRKRRRIWSLMVCTIVIAGLFAPCGALDVPAPADQVGPYYEADHATGELPDMPEHTGDTVKRYADGWVETDKTIAPGEKENEFLITLDVRTREEISERVVSEDAAAVLVFDLSGSMDEARLSKAKEAAKAFVADFAGTANADTQRKIAVVGFSGSKPGDLGGGRDGIPGAVTYQGWTDATDRAVAQKIDSMQARGGTCLQAGLVLARNLLNSGEMQDMANRNIVVLTDGRPTYYLTDAAAQDTATDRIGAPNQIQGQGNDTDHATHTKTEATARAVAEEGIRVYGIYLGNEKVNCPNARSSWLSRPTCDVNYMAGGDWLAGPCGMTAYAVENAQELTRVFQSISEWIRIQAEAWKVKDPIGSQFVFDGFAEAPGAQGPYTYNAEAGQVEWDLTGTQPVNTADGVSEYRLTYKLKLNTLADGYTAGQYYPTNGVTSVSYVVERESQDGTDTIENGTAYFNVPSAKGYAADLTFRKTDETGRALAGAVFALWHGDTRMGTATSGEDGTVRFADIPSGQTYTVKEESAPPGYVKEDTSYPVRISYGRLSGEIGTDFAVVNQTVRPEPVYGDLVVSKTVSGEDAPEEDEFYFTVTLGDTGINGRYGDMEFTSGVAGVTLQAGEQATANGLPAGTTYTVAEEWTEDYIPNQTDFRGTIPENGTATAAFDNFYQGGRIGPGQQLGGLTVSKTVSGDGADRAARFPFTVTLDDTTINGTYDQMTFADGVAEFTLADGESVTAGRLPAGTTYVVREDGNEGYTVTVNGEDAVQTGGVIEADGYAEAAFCNHRDSEPVRADLQFCIVKAVEATGGVIPEGTHRFAFVVSTSQDAADAVMTDPVIEIEGTGTRTTTVTLDVDKPPQALYVWEKADEASAGWTYDTSVYRVTFTEDAEGAVIPQYEKLTAEGETADPASVTAVSFVNAFDGSATPAPAQDFPGTPVAGDPLTEPDPPAAPTAQDTGKTAVLQDVPQTGDLAKLELWTLLACVALLALITTVQFGRSRLIRRRCRIHNHDTAYQDMQCDHGTQEKWRN